jgi:uncharacterized membrane protein YdbT with pleckstrin-like domain
VDLGAKQKHPGDPVEPFGAHAGRIIRRVAFPKRLLADHERLVLDLRPHWIALVAPVTITVLILVAEILLFSLFDPPEALAWVAVIWGIVLFVAFPLRAFLSWVTSHFVVTTDRVVHRAGWLAKRSMDMPLERINDVTFSQSVIERALGAGTLRIQSGGEYGQNYFRDIRNPEDVQKMIYELGEANQRRTEQPAPAAPPTEATGASPLDEIERLGGMKDRGLISEEEFETHKRRLLGRM